MSSWLIERKYFVILLVTVVMLGAILRTYQLDAIPTGIYGDEAYNGYEAIETLESGDFKAFYPANNGREGLFIWLMTIPHAWLPPSEVTLRLTPAVIGILTLLLLPLMIGRGMRFYEETQPKNDFLIVLSSLMACFFLATSYWHINFSRIAFRAILDPLFSLLVLMFLFNSLKHQRTVILAMVTGLIAGLGLYGYGAYKFMCIPILYVFISAWLKPQRPAVSNYLIITLLTVLAIVPLGLYVLNHSDEYFLRLNSLASLSQDKTFLAKLADSFVEVMKMLFWHSDSNLRHNLDQQPQLLPLVAFSFVVGTVNIILAALGKKIAIGWLLIRTDWLPKKWARLLMVWWFAMLIPFAMVFYGDPHALRAIGLLIPCIIISGIGFACVYASLQQFMVGKYSIFLLLITLGLMVWNTYLVSTQYFNDFVKHGATKHYFQLGRTQLAKGVKNMPDNQKQIILVAADNDLEKNWDIQQFLYFTEGKLARYNAALIPFSQFKFNQEVSHSVIYVPAFKEEAFKKLIPEQFSYRLY